MYEKLWVENWRCGWDEFEYELLDIGVFDGGWYFDVMVEYVKGGLDDLLIEIMVVNCGLEIVWLWLLLMLWYWNIWLWGCMYEGCEVKLLLK